MATSSKELWDANYKSKKVGKKTNYEFVCKEILKDKKTTILWLQEHRLLHDAPQCNICGQEMKMEAVTGENATSDGYRWRCRKRGKNSHQTTQSIRKHSWFEKSNLSIAEIIKFTYWWSRQVRQDLMEHELNISSVTCVDWCSFAREVCEESLIKKSQPIGGPEIRVEIDEAKFGKRKYHRGRQQNGQWVFGGRETEDRSKIFMVPVESRDEQTLLPIIQKWILPGSIIQSDCWKSYSKLQEMGYTHLTVNHNVEFTNRETGACTNHIENEWLHARKGLPLYGTRHKHFVGYLAEHIWRTKTKSEGKDPFLEFLNAASEVYDVRNPPISIPS